MNVKRIVVDELPEDGCCECRFSKVYTSIFGNDKVRCVVTNKSVSDFAFGYTKQPRPSWCPLVIEDVCEWKHKFYDTYETKHGSMVSQSSYIFCPKCGKRIKRIKYESEE